jgi:predicted enzyme related to lactoylglutathione lyase
MSTRTTPWEPGTPCWADLATTDVAAANAFYAAVLGWEIADTGEEFGHYGIASRGGLATAGVGPIMGGDQPPAWTTYLATEDADKTAEAIATHGGQVIAAPMAVGSMGRMAVAIDPTGAPFGLWQAEEMIGCQLVNEPGGVVWNDHHSADLERAKAFYAAVFGYSYTAMDGDNYVTIDGAGPGDTVGGLGTLADSLPGSPPHWMVYFAVEDTDAAVEAALKHGGQVLVPAADTPFGRMATLRDGQGATFVVGSTPDELPAQS